MFFRNLKLFRITGLDRTQRNALVSELDEACAGRPARQPGPLEFRSVGFVPPLGQDGSDMLLTSGAAKLFTLGINDKVLPPSSVNAEVAKRTREASKIAGRPIGGRARREIRYEVLDALLPQALVRPTRINGYMDADSGWMVLDTPSPKAAETVLTVLRDALGSLPIQPPAPADPPRMLMTQWLANGRVPPGLWLGDECELRDFAGGAITRCRRQELEGTEIREHLRQGKQCTRLALQFEDRLWFVLDEDLTVRKLRFLDVVQESLDTSDHDDVEDEFSARFALMTLELRRLLDTLSAVFGIDAGSDR